MRKLLLFSFVLIISGLLIGGTLAAGHASLHVTADEDLGHFLVDGSGMTLYIFDRDENGESACYDQCAENWPPLIADSADMLPTASAGVAAGLGTTERTDGTLQVTYDDMPLYYFIGDAAAGDTNGQGLNEVWWVAGVEAIGLSNTEDLGSFLVDADGMTLYLFDRDENGESACYDQCAENWPPLLAESADALPAAVDGVAAGLGTTERTDGTVQVTYDDMPLYHFIGDATAGETNGQGLNEVWWVVNVDALQTNEHADLGHILVDADGMTLYLFTNDVDGESVCYEDCATNWPPLMADNADDLPAALAGIPYAFGTTERTDGTFQVTYGGMPLYHFIGDAAAGDANGQGRGEVWFVIELD